MEGCRYAFLITSFLIKGVFCVNSRKCFYQLFGCHKANIGPRTRKQFCFPDISNIASSSTQKLWEPLNEIEFLSTAKLICGIRTKSVCYIRQSVCYTRKVCYTQCNVLSNCSQETMSKTTYSNLFQTTYWTCLLMRTQRKETLFKLMNILVSDRALC